VPLRAIEEKFADSVHGRAGVGCADCHRLMESLAAERATGASRLDSIVCKTCHSEQVAQYVQSVHAKASDKVCFACHDPHGSVPFSSLRGEERQAICQQCHTAVQHDWLPQERLHFNSLECATCHSPKSRKGISFTFEAGTTGKKLEGEILEALKVGAADEIVRQVDPDGDGVAETGELLDFLQRLGGVLPDSPQLRAEVLILESYHDFSKGGTRVKQCTQCHSAQAEFYEKLFVQLPAPGGGVTSLPVERAILGQMQSARQLGDLYLLGEGRIGREDVEDVLTAMKRVGYRWIDILGVLVLLGGVGFVAGHSLLRILTISRRRRRTRP
jgi:predicted CXXCH cytochrome family protein